MKSRLSKSGQPQLLTSCLPKLSKDRWIPARWPNPMGETEVATSASPILGVEGECLVPDVSLVCPPTPGRGRWQASKASHRRHWASVCSLVIGLRGHPRELLEPLKLQETTQAQVWKAPRRAAEGPLSLQGPRGPDSRSPVAP